MNICKLSMNHILMSVIICYDYSYEMEVLKNGISFLVEILKLNHMNLMIFYDYILSKISDRNKSNIFVHKLNQLVMSYFNFLKERCIPINGKLNGRIIYNIGIITENLRILLKQYKTKRNGYLISIFKKINEITDKEIDKLFTENILRINKAKGSSFFSTLLEDNKDFRKVPAPYIKLKNKKPFSLILDLDKTLAHSEINIMKGDEVIIRLRPGIFPFLEEVEKYYELIIFTEDTQDYADKLIDTIEESNIYFDYRFYRQHMVIIDKGFVKDLNRIGRPLDKVIIVDNMPQNFRLQKDNGIQIKAFWGEDVYDNALEELGKILVNIAKEGGDLRIGIKKYKDDILNKVSLSSNLKIE